MRDPILDEEFRIGDKRWRISTLVFAAKGLKKFKLPINFINRSYQPFDIDDFQMFVDHYNRVSDADMNVPVILSPCGLLMDGRHRVIRAMIDGKKFVWAVQLEELPQSD